jgi:glycerophosphoryl diester phosphodiesterase
VNNPAHMRMLIAAGVDGIMSDYPDRLVAASKREPHGAESGPASKSE